MSRRVYEIAQEQDLSTKEVLGRLNEAGMEVKSPLASVEDSSYERVFGDGREDATHNGPLEGQDLEILLRSLEPRREFSQIQRVLAYILIATLAFALSVGVGALAALTSRGELGFTASEKPRPSEEQGTPQQNEEQGNAQHSEADYVSKVGKLQSESVKAFLDSHDKLLRYDALTADHIEEMQANQAALQEFTDQTDDLKPPQKYREQKDVYLSAINELHEAAQLAYALAADPTSATQSGFEVYDNHVDKAAALLQRSNEILGKDYKTIEGVQRVSPP